MSGANRAAPLSADDLDGLAEAAFWLGRYREALPARQGPTTSTCRPEITAEQP
ncbi:MAG: hypothetical protein M3228_14445 [Actinomycetota bacterium]|nr:hypothetical protein [Actinomycetota bacterium]